MEILRINQRNLNPEDMVSRLFYSFIFLTLLCCCTNTTQSNCSQSEISINITGDNITFHGIEIGTDIAVSIDNVASSIIKLEQDSTLSIINALRSLNKANEIALLSAKNDGEIAIRLKVENSCDTTFVYKLPTDYIDSYSSNILGTAHH